MLLSDAKESFKLSRIVKLPEAGGDSFEPFFKGMEEDGRERMQQAGFAAAEIACKRAVEMRYSGQEFTIRLPFSEPAVTDVPGDLHARFAALHELRYGHAFERTPSEVVAMHVEVYGHLPKPTIRFAGSAPGECAPRAVYFEDHGFIETKIYRREALVPGIALEGPAIVEEAASTTLVHPGDRFSVDGDSNIVITVASLSALSREAVLRAGAPAV
jgi:N-methylhydantoinase A